MTSLCFKKNKRAVECNNGNSLISKRLTPPALLPGKRRPPVTFKNEMLDPIRSFEGRSFEVEKGDEFEE